MLRQASAYGHIRSRRRPASCSRCRTRSCGGSLRDRPACPLRGNAAGDAKRPENFTAYDFTLRALDVMNALDESTFPKALEFLEQAMAEDPRFSMPAAWAARWHSINIGQGWSVDRDHDAEQALLLASRALELEPDNALALATYGHLRSFIFHDVDTALTYFDRALAACPNIPSRGACQRYTGLCREGRASGATCRTRAEIVTFR